MNNIVDLSIPVAKTIEQHPELKEFLVELGFKPLANPMMLKTVGAITPLKQGAKMIGLPLADLVQQLEWNGYTVKGLDDHEQ